MFLIVYVTEDVTAFTILNVPRWSEALKTFLYKKWIKSAVLSLKNPFNVHQG